METSWTINGGQWSYRLCTRASSQQPRGRTLPTDANGDAAGEAGKWGRAAPNHLGSALRAAWALAGPGFLLRRKRWRPTAQPASSQICLTGILEPSSTSARHAGSSPHTQVAGPTRRGSTGSKGSPPQAGTHRGGVQRFPRASVRVGPPPAAVLQA